MEEIYVQPETKEVSKQCIKMVAYVFFVQFL